MKTEPTPDERSPALRYASVCSGIDAVTVAWTPLGLTPAWFSEIDPFANAVLAHHYPHVPNLGDMTHLAPRVASGAVSAPEIFVGGTPCQSFSIAGLRKGLTDPRGALTLTYVELANAIDQVRITQDQAPAVHVWENVPGVLSEQSNAFGCFLGAMAGESRELRPAGPRWTHAGCVYGPQRSIAWRVLDAQYFGLAQRRKRVFVVASARHDFDPGAILFECGGLRRDTPPRTQTRQDTASLASSRIAQPDPSEHGERSPAAQAAPSVCFGGGNAGGPIDRAACLTASGHKDDFEVETFAVQMLKGPVSHPLSCAHDVTEDGNGRGVPIISMRYRLDESDSVAFAQNSRGEIRLEGGRGDLVGALSTGGGKPGQGLPTIASLSRGTRPPERRSSDRDDDRTCSFRAGTRSDEARSRLPSSFEAHFHGVPTAGDGRLDDASNWHVRRLLPLECERLQGLPDNYTLVTYRGYPAADGPRYRAIGNSIAVPCVAWIGRRLIEVLSRSGR